MAVTAANSRRMMSPSTSPTTAPVPRPPDSGRSTYSGLLTTGEEQQRFEEGL